jgi:23S rRNA (guanosine2251-2'-O)-methyltransferase
MKERLAGVNSIMEALKSNRKVYKIFVQEGRAGKKVEDLIKLAGSRGIYVQPVPKQKLNDMYKTGNHQGVVAEVDVYQYSTVEEVLEYAALQGEPPLILILDGLEDPQNLGSVIRSAEGAGVHGVVIPRHNSAEVTPAVVRASAGAVEHMKVVLVTNLVNTIKDLKDQGLWVIGADMDGQDYYTVEIPAPTALVIGGEGQGIRRLVKENCDLIVKIPMRGQVNSLNASAAAAVMLFEAVRQRTQKRGANG